jgi:predicted RNase H-like HicB family nuclease
VPSIALNSRLDRTVRGGAHSAYDAGAPPVRRTLGAASRAGYTGQAMNLTIEIEQEEDGRWIAEVVELPGTLVYGNSRDESVARAQALALRVIAERLEHGEAAADLVQLSFVAA